MTQKDSTDIHSYLRVVFPEAYEMDYVALVVRSPALFKRKVTIEANGVTIFEGSVASDQLMFSVASVKTKALRVDIDNADNAPLVINEVACFQASRYLLAY